MAAQSKSDAERVFEAKYDLLDHIVLGEGTYGKVYKARCHATNKLVAMKHMKLGGDEEGVPSTAIREVAILKELNHVNVVKLLDVFCTTNKLVLVFECLDNDLKKFMRASKGVLDPSVIKDFGFQLTLGIDYCHTNRIIHRDLKPQNLLISQSMQLKLADFGLARAFVLPMPKYTHEVVTVWYRPPEILLGTTFYSLAIDLWAEGCILAEMATGAPLFRGDSEIDTVFKIFQKLGTPTEAMWPGLSELPDFKPTFPKWPTRSWKTIRNTAAQMGHDGIDLLEQLMQYAPERRLSARRTLDHPYFAEMINMSISRHGGA